MRTVPENWKDFSFSLPAYGGGKLEAEVKNGKFAKLKYDGKGKTKRTLLLPKRLVPEEKVNKSWKDCGDFYAVDAPLSW